jgi:hypothetical protein
MTVFSKAICWTNVVSSVAFLLGSLLFLPRFASYATTGVWLFALGSLLMLIGALHANFTRDK